MFMTTQLTRWFHPEELGLIVQRQEILSDRSWSTVGVKITCGWLCGLIYLVFLLMPGKKNDKSILSKIITKSYILPPYYTKYDKQKVHLSIILQIDFVFPSVTIVLMKTLICVTEQLDHVQPVA